MRNNFINLTENMADSSDYADLKTSITHSKKNMLVLDNMSTYIKINDEITISVYDFLNKYRNVLETFLIEIEIDKSYYYKPEYVSYEVYSTTDLWYLLLFLNNMLDPSEFNRSTIKILDPAHIDILNEIYIREKNNVGNKDNPLEIEKSRIKSLNKSSDYLFKQDTRVIQPRPLPDKIKKSIVIKDFLNGFINNTKEIFTKTIIGKENSDYYLIDGIKLNNNLSYGIPKEAKSNYNVELDLLFLSKKEGVYRFKPLLIGTCECYVEGALTKTISSPNFNAYDNIYESYNSNFDFNLNNLDGWQTNKGEIVYDSILGKNVYHCEIDSIRVSEYELISTSISGENLNGKDLYFNSVIKTVNLQNMTFISPKIIINYENDLDIFEMDRVPISSNTNSFINFEMVCNKRLENEIKSVDIIYKVYGSSSSPMSGIFELSELQIKEYEMDYFYFPLQTQIWNNIKFIYKNYNSTTNFKMLLKDTENLDFIDIDSNLISFESFEDINYKHIEDRIKILVLSDNKKDLYEKLLSPTTNLNFINKNILQNKNSFIKIEFFVDNIENDTIFKLNGNNNDNIKLYFNNSLFLQKESGKDFVEGQIENSLINTKMNKFILEINHLNASKENLSLSYYDNSGKLKDISELNNYSIIDTSKWNPLNNELSLSNSIYGLYSYISNSFTDKMSYNIKCNFKFSDLNNNPMFGIIFRKFQDDYYLFTMKLESDTKNIISGLYKVSNKYKKISLDNEGKYKIHALELTKNTNFYNMNGNNNIFIQLVNNRIRIYDSYNGGKTIIDFLDTSDPILQGDFGFISYNSTESMFNEFTVEFF